MEEFPKFKIKDTISIFYGIVNMRNFEMEIK